MANHTKPTLIKQLEGNPGKRPLNKNEPVPHGVPQPPNYFSELHMLVWERLIDAAPANLLKTIDSDLLVLYVEAYLAHEAAAKILIIEGITQTTAKGDSRAHPMLAVQRNSASQLIRLCGELGFSPAARVKLTVIDNDDEEDDFEEFA